MDDTVRAMAYRVSDQYARDAAAGHYDESAMPLGRALLAERALSEERRLLLAQYVDVYCVGCGTSPPGAYGHAPDCSVPRLIREGE
jgi:hypothetical protein